MPILKSDDYQQNIYLSDEVEFEITSSLQNGIYGRMVGMGR
jgi:hypothetical protein